MVQTAAGPHHRCMSEYILHPTESKRLERSSSRILVGVCGGLGRYFDLSPAVFRLGFVVLSVIGGAGILVYVAAALVIPAEGKESSTAEEILSQRRDHPTRLVALGFVAVAILAGLSRANTWPNAGAAWLIVLVAGLGLLVAGRKSRSHRLLIGVAMAIGLLIAATVAAVVVAFAWFDVSLDDGVGKRTYAPTVTATDARYELGIGNLTVDLSQHSTKVPLHVHAHLGIGELRVIVPRNVSLVLDSRVKVGDRSVASEGGSGGPFTVDANVGAGHIDVVRAG
jgi:phage shock protein PspC (stress-responsive transcriptional regulator)